MKPAPFEYAAPTTVDEALAAAAADEEAKFLAGGQSLIPLLALRLSQPTTLVDLGGIAELNGIAPAASAGTVWIGAATRHHQLEEQQDIALLAEAARWIGHTAIRSRGTIGGSVAHADPAAEWPSVLVALNATAEVATADGSRRTIGLADGFFGGHFQTALPDGELVTGFAIERPRRWGFAELARRAGDFALVLVVAAELADGWRLVAGGVGATPLRLAEAEGLLDEGADPTEVGIAAAAAVDPPQSLHASPRYLKAMTAEYTTRAITQAVSR